MHRRRGHKSELPPTYDSILSTPEKSLPQQMRARAELSPQLRWDNQDGKQLRPTFYTALFFQELQYRTVPERSAHLTRCGPPRSSGCQPLTLPFPTPICWCNFARHGNAISAPLWRRAKTIFKLSCVPFFVRYLAFLRTMAAH